MLRRLIDGLGLVVLVWFLVARLDAGEVALGLALGLVFAFTGWRVYRLWRKYRHLLAELAAAEEARLSDDPAEVQRAERILRSRRMMQAAEMSMWTGFVMGAAMDGSRAMGPGGEGGEAAGGYDGAGSDGSGGFTGGDFGGGGFDGGM